MTALVECPACEGHGEIGVSQDYWGNWNTRPCSCCGGECEVSLSRAAEWYAEVEV